MSSPWDPTSPSPRDDQPETQAAPLGGGDPGWSAPSEPVGGGTFETQPLPPPDPSAPGHHGGFPTAPMPQGPPPAGAGTPPWEQAPNAQPKYGQAPYAQPQYGQAPYAQPQYGQAPYAEQGYAQGPYAHQDGPYVAGGGYQPYYRTAALDTAGAVAQLVVGGVLTVTCCLFIPGICALIFGAVAMNRGSQADVDKVVRYGWITTGILTGLLVLWWVASLILGISTPVTGGTVDMIGVS